MRDSGTLCSYLFIPLQFALFFSTYQLSYTCQFFSLCSTLDTSGVFRQYPHCLPVCVVFVHLSVDVLLIDGQFYNIERRNLLAQPPVTTMRSALYLFRSIIVFLTHQEITKILIGIFCRCILSLAHFVRIKMR